MTDEIYHDLVDRLAAGVNRRQAVVGGEKLFSLAKRGQVGLVWGTEDLSRRALGKLRVECAKLQVPLFIRGNSEELGEKTLIPTAKVYILKRGFSGLNMILRGIDDEFER